MRYALAGAAASCMILTPALAPISDGTGAFPASGLLSPFQAPWTFQAPWRTPRRSLYGRVPSGSGYRVASEGWASLGRVVRRRISAIARCQMSRAPVASEDESMEQTRRVGGGRPFCDPGDASNVASARTRNSQGQP